ncbi:MAG: DNA primase [Desulfobacterales bacterium]|nr:DNA primase [Desulfobacterales bacterium]
MTDHQVINRTWGCSFLTGYIPEEKIAEIRTAADIVDIISESVVLKKSGRNFLGLCPFHAEKTPSFSVNREKQIFYCFGCGAGGNVFTFLMKHDGMSFPEAVRVVAGKYGIELPVQGQSPEQRRRYSEREKILAINLRAAEFFRGALYRKGTGDRAMAYLHRRQMPAEVLEDFQIGFAPAGWDNLASHARQTGLPLPLVEKAGLIVPRKSGDGYYDRFRERIIFPIQDVGGRVIGFGGRVLDDTLPKYLNSPENPVYHKSRSLYGAHQARNHCRQTGTVFVVEGYFDVLSLQQSGIKNAVATLGTSLTVDHVRMLRGFVGEAGRVVLVYDSDEAGIRAAERSIQVFDKEYVDAQIIVLPAGHDPDSFVCEHGGSRFAALAEKAQSVIPFLMDSAKNRHGLSVEGKVKIVAEMASPLAALADPVKRALYIRELSERLGIEESALLEKIRAAGSDDFKKRAEQRQLPDWKNAENRLERKIVAMMLQFPDILDNIDQRKVLDHFSDSVLRRIGAYVLAQRDRPVRASEIVEAIEGSEDTVAALAMEDEPWNRKSGLQLIAQLLKGGVGRSRDDLMQEILAAEKGSDEASLDRLLAEKYKQAVRREKEKMALLKKE